MTKEVDKKKRGLTADLWAVNSITEVGHSIYTGLDRALTLLFIHISLTQISHN